MFNINIEGDVRDNIINQVDGDLVTSTKEEKDVLSVLYHSLITLQSRKYILDGEEKKNEILSDLLRQNKLFASDETRQGRSGSNNNTNYKSGELDIGIRCPETGNIISIIEALELGSCGPKNKVVKEHIGKLIKRYDTARNESNYIVIYSIAQKFDELWSNYKRYVETKVFEEDIKVELIRKENFDKRGIKVARTVHHVHGSEQKLFHLFVDMST